MATSFPKPHHVHNVEEDSSDEEGNRRRDVSSKNPREFITFICEIFTEYDESELIVEDYSNNLSDSDDDLFLQEANNLISKVHDKSDASHTSTEILKEILILVLREKSVSKGQSRSNF